MQNGGVPITKDFEKRVADVLGDIEKVPDDDFTDADENDPVLLAELKEITDSAKPSTTVGTQGQIQPPAILLPTTILSKIEVIKARILMYEQAEQAANQTDESCRARRFNRGIQQLQEMLKQAQGGKDVNLDEIPPEVSMKNVQTECEGDETKKVEEKKSG